MGNLDPYIKQFTKPQFSYEIGNIYFEPSYLQAGLIILLLFLLVLTLARLRKMYVGWSLGKSAIAMVMWGFILAVIVEAFLFIGGNTIFTLLLGWKSAPKPISTVLDMGRSRLVNVLGASTVIPNEESNITTSEKLFELFNNLSDAEKIKFNNKMCTP